MVVRIKETPELNVARHYRVAPEEKVVCVLCPQACVLREGEAGRCRVRKVKDGRLIAKSYGQVSSIALDPIEKKPLYHFYPGALVLSVGTVGCNLACRFCQNWEIAHGNPTTRYLAPEELVAMALQYRAKGNIGLAYTYSEPLVWYEYILDTAELAHQEGLKNILVTNGYINPGPLQELAPFLDGVNLDLKGWTDDFYRSNCEGRVKPVLETAEFLAKKTLLEVTTLLIPGENDQEEDLRALVGFLADLDPGIPLHLSRYFPHYRMTASPTPLETMKKAYRLAKERLHYVYLGNIAETEYIRTECPDCGGLWVERSTLSIRITGLEDGRCQKCGRKADLLY